ncbi:MAG: phosphorylase [Deltaproteobacteria bacterium]|nr:phosphorylase [Deltaproteobacteria bacterium]
MIQPGTLWQKTVQQTRRALQIGALKPIETESSFVRDQGADFLVRTVAGLACKARERQRHRYRSYAETTTPNPFLPYDRAMFVADISPTHLCLLNKYNVIEHHLLIVTRAFREQEELLDFEDFEALWICMAEFEALGFYNGGEASGASQRHKHLQLVPLPLAERGPRVPIEPLIGSAKFKGRLATIPCFPFVHSIAKLDPILVNDAQRAASETLRLYRLMLEKVGLNKRDSLSGQAQAGPYNLLVAREWMLLVPRRCECFKSISVNALGFAGAMLVKDKDEMRSLSKHGPIKVLEHTALPMEPTEYNV